MRANNFQINGGACSAFVLAEPVATVFPFVTFRNVKNREDEFFLAFALRVFQFRFILFTSFRQGFRFVVKLPKQFVRTIVLNKVNPARQADVGRYVCSNLRWSSGSNFSWDCTCIKQSQSLLDVIMSDFISLQVMSDILPRVWADKLMYQIYFPGHEIDLSFDVTQHRRSVWFWKFAKIQVLISCWSDNAIQFSTVD